ncbi:MAG: response regulator transcription factor [Cyclobacteriaceae bacterium]|nr:response regulator transcription factor [Cyclobacteriaceae bacterium]
MAVKIKVFHLEDYKIIRDGIKFLLTTDEEIAISGEASDFDELMKKLDGQTDILLLDIYLDSMKEVKTIDGFEICTIVNQKFPKIKVIFHSVYDDADRVARAMKAGAMGFISKKAGYQELIQGIKVVYSGKKYICEATSKRLKNLNRFLIGLEDTLKSKDEFFSKREKQVLELLAKGYSSRAIAKKLFIAEKTVESHRKNLVSKAEVKNTNELIAYSFARGLISM